ncbi:DctP family TRAP transporter solute-binding subunit [Thalassospira sp. TSL5-1]|uniref:DctP family TRAP transporter solute-binding subunit n=1 Tax=Thalassospira sp. TSL5-1 TaxID=1544451 RepID=UPI0009400E89|nr:DctP family TRAP transporter solute-binding subunit [Thalassospira sp. TSL5-1]OKH87632.1 C4-dicarboxylate ABC transporter [Thalassospira sp. TSL5-1]
MKFFKCLPALVMGAALALTGTAHTAHAADYKSEYKVSTVLGKPFPWGEAAGKWAELVAERTDGRINLKVYPNAQLVAGDQTKEFTAMRQGIIDMAVGSTINWSPQVKELNLFSLPFLMPDFASMDALTQGPVGEKIFDAIRKQGIEPIGWAENGFREVTNSKHPITSPADLDGLKMRVVGSPLYNDIFTALGANPTQMSWADAKPALTTGAVDGQENPLTVYDVAQMETAGQTYITLWHYVADPLIFAVNKRVWGSFSDEDKAIVKQAADDAGAYGIALARKGMTDDDQSLIKALEARGAKITTLTPEQRQKFVDATRDVYNKWKERIGPDLVDMAEKSIANR